MRQDRHELRILREGCSAAGYAVGRMAERLLPPAVLYTLLWPGAAGVAAGRLLMKPLHRSLPWHPGLRPLWRHRTQMTLACLAYVWRDRFRQKRWRKRIRMRGTEYLTGERPTLLVTLHYGPLNLLVRVLRTHGHAAAILVSPEAFRYRTVSERRIDRLADERMGFGDLPGALAADAIWEARDYLQNAGPLVVVADGEIGGRTMVRSGGVGVALGTRGILRLAEIAGADVIPCLVRAGSGFRMTADLGAPLPRRFVECRALHKEGYKTLLGGLLELAGRAPGQCSGSLSRLFASP